MSKKIKDLSNDDLNELTAKAQGWYSEIHDFMRADYRFREVSELSWMNDGKMMCSVSDYKPTENWSQAGQLIDKYHIQTGWDSNENGDMVPWAGNTDEYPGVSSNTTQRAICIIVCINEFGEEIDLK